MQKPPRDRRSPDTPTALLVHGILDTGRVFRPMRRALERHGVQCLAPDLAPSHGGARLETLAAQLAEAVERHAPPQAPLHVIAFSMGALVARHWIQYLHGHERTSSFYAIAAPNAGSIWCHASLLPGVRQMRPGSDFLRRLDADVTCFDRIPAVAYWTPFDLVIRPPTNSLLPFAENVRVLSLCHQCLLRHPQVIGGIRERIHAHRRTMPPAAAPA